MCPVQSMYKASKKRFDDDPEFKERARKAVTQLQGGNADFITAWERICEASRKVCLPSKLANFHQLQGTSKSLIQIHWYICCQQDC